MLIFNLLNIFLFHTDSADFYLGNKVLLNLIFNPICEIIINYNEK